MGPFELFPQLVWEEFIEKVEKPKDKLIVAQSHPQLENLFENNIGEWKFALIAKIFWSKTPPVSPSNWYSYDVRKDFLSCRLVSRSILKCTDAFTDKYYMKTREDTTSSFLSCKLQRTKSDLKNCLEIFKLSNFPKSWNPIPFRHLSISCNCGRTAEESFNVEDAQLFLQEIGFHLRSLYLGVKIQSQAQLAASPTIFCKIFNSLPNLANFHFRVTFELDEDPETRQAPFQSLIPSKLVKLRCLTMLGSCAYLLLKGIDISDCFSTLVHFNFCFSLWKDEYNKCAQFPELQVFASSDIPIPDAKNSLFGLFCHMKTPKLETVILGLQDGTEFTTRKEYNRVVRCIEKVGLLTLQQQFPDLICRSYVSSIDRRPENILDDIEFEVVRKHV